MVNNEFRHSEKVTEALKQKIAMLETKLKEAEEAIHSRDNEINHFKCNVGVLVGQVRKLALATKQPATDPDCAEDPMKNPNTKIAILEEQIGEIQEIVRHKESTIKALEQNLSGKIRDLETQLRNKEKLLMDRDRQVNDLQSQLEMVICRMNEMSSFLRQAEALANIETQGPGTVAEPQLKGDKDTLAAGQTNNLDVTSPAADQAIVAPDIFDEIIRELTQIMGPIATMIVRHDVAALGESIERFPMRRLAELLDVVTKELPDENVKRTFRERFVENVYLSER
jgi:chromosome segregation ATPase